MENLEKKEMVQVEGYGDVEVVTEKQMEDEIKAKYPKVYKISLELEEEDDKEFTFYFKKPTTASFNRAVKTMSKKLLESMKVLTLESIVEEQKDEYQEVIENYPGMVTTIGQKLLGMLGVTDSITLKKL